MTDARQFSPSTARNREAILEVLCRVLPSTGTVLEIASGTGEHAAFFAPRLPHLFWQPSDIDSAALASIEAWRTCVDAPNLRPVVMVDAAAQPWSVGEAAAGGAIDRPDAMFSANMVHIAPWVAAQGLLAEAGRLLAPGAPLVLYGPFKVSGRHTAPSNEAFDASLRARNTAWGVRDREALATEAALRGLALEETVQMPANNLILVFRKAPAVV